MDIQAFQLGDKWIIACGVGISGGEGIHGSRSRKPGRKTFTECWTGKDWVGQFHLAMPFDTVEALGKHWNENEAAMMAALEQ